MNIAEVKRVVQEQEIEKDRILKEGKVIARDVDPGKLNAFLKYPNILTILGIRRCGKSVLSWLLMEKKKRRKFIG